MQCSFDAVINWKAEAEYRQISIFNLTINSALYRAANTGRGSNPCGKFSFDNLIVLIGRSSLPRVYDKIAQNVIACFGLDMKLKSELKLFVQWSSTNQSESLSLQKYQNLHNEVKIMCFDPKRFVQRLYETFIPAWGSLSGR